MEEKPNYFQLEFPAASLQQGGAPGRERGSLCLSGRTETAFTFERRRILQEGGYFTVLILVSVNLFSREGGWGEGLAFAYTWSL